MVKVVAFDLDNTLWHVDPAIEKAEANMNGWLRQHFPGKTNYFEDKEKYTTLRRTVYEEHVELVKRYQLREVREAIIVEGLRKGGAETPEIEEKREAAIEYWMQQRSSCVEPFPYCEQMLRELKQDFKLVAITNGNADLKYCNLDQYFDYHIAAWMPGMKPKPEPDMFHTILSRFCVEPNEVIMVGDDPRCDIQPALSLGMHSILVNIVKSGSQPTDQLPNVQQVTHLSQVSPAVQRILCSCNTDSP